MAHPEDVATLVARTNPVRDDGCHHRGVVELLCYDCEPVIQDRDPWLIGMCRGKGKHQNHCCNSFQSHFNTFHASAYLQIPWKYAIQYDHMQNSRRALACHFAALHEDARIEDLIFTVPRSSLEIIRPLSNSCLYWEVFFMQERLLSNV